MIQHNHNSDELCTQECIEKIINHYWQVEFGPQHPKVVPEAIKTTSRPKPSWFIIAVTAALAFDCGGLFQYVFDARLVRSELHGHHFTIAKNLADEAEFRREAIGFLMNGREVK